MPGKIPAGKVVREPISHIDVFATLLDYLQASDFDESDGESLRRFIDGQAYNAEYDEAVAVVELEKVGKNVRGREGGIPNFMIRHGGWKLIVPKEADSDVLDMVREFICVVRHVS